MSTPTPPKTILITGASGNYARLATTLLLAAGHPPTHLILTTRDPSTLSSSLDPAITIRRASFDDPVPVLATAFAGAHALLLISTSRAGARLPQHAAAVAAARAAGVAHVVYTSIVSAGLAAIPTALVAREHRATEGMLREAEAAAAAEGGKKFAWTALRDAQYADAMAEVAAVGAVAEGVLRCNAGDGKVAFVARRDCVEVAVAVVLGGVERHGGKCYEVTGPELMGWGDAARVMGEVVGREVRYEALGDGEMMAFFDGMGVPREAVDGVVVKGVPWSSEDMVSFGKATRLGEMAVVSGDVELLTGKKPMSFREVMEESWARRKAAGLV